MIVSDRLEGLYYLILSSSTNFLSISPLARRMVAMGILSEMRTVISLLEDLNDRLGIEISEDDADIDFDLWSDRKNTDRIQYIFNPDFYIEDENDKTAINNMTDLFPVGKSTTFKDGTPEQLKSAMKQLSSEDILNHSDITKALRNGIGKIFAELTKAKEKMSNITDDLYANYCEKYLVTDFDLVFQNAERVYSEWKEEHECNNVQFLEDKRTQELLKVLSSGVFSHSTMPTNREINSCKITISTDALEHDMQLPEEINVDCARFARFVEMKEQIMLLDYVKLGKYLYKHHKEISFDEGLSLKHFDLMLDYIHQDMAKCDKRLKPLLKDYEDNQLQAVLDSTIEILESCKEHLNESVTNDFLSSYTTALFYGDLKRVVQKSLQGQSKYTLPCRMIGMLKASGKVFKVEATSDVLTNSVSTVIDGLQKKSITRYINDGASDLNAQVRKWTDKYVKETIFTKEERLFVGLSEK